MVVRKPAVMRVFFIRGIYVYIRFLGNGYLWFRPYGGSLSKSAKVTKALLPHHSVPRLGSACPHSGIAPWARREGSSMAQRGYPGIHAGMPTAQCLRSAIVVNGAPKSTSTARRPYSRPVSWWDCVSPVGAGLLAKALVQSMKMLDVSASSRAGSLPQNLIGIPPERTRSAVRPPREQALLPQVLLKQI